jgi:hypothetical protein
MTAASPPVLSRRGFIGLGAALAGAALLAGDLPVGRQGLAALLDTGLPRLPVGYLDASAGARTLSEALGAGAGRVVPASSLRPLTGLASDGLSMAVRALTPAARLADAAIHRVYVDAHFAVPGGATVPFYAWTHQSGSTDSVANFAVPDGDGLRIGLVVDAAAPSTGTTGPPASTEPTLTVFTTGSESGLPRLQQGVYLLGLRRDLWQSTQAVPALDDPAWSELSSIVVTVRGAS